MPKTNAPPKIFIATRITEETKQKAEKTALEDGMSLSEWLRNIILEKLRTN